MTIIWGFREWISQGGCTVGPLRHTPASSAPYASNKLHYCTLNMLDTLGWVCAPVCLLYNCCTTVPRTPNVHPTPSVDCGMSDCAFATAVFSAMQLFVRCGCPEGSVSLDCAPSDTVLEVKDRLCARTSGRLGTPDLMVRSIRNLRRLRPTAKVCFATRQFSDSPSPCFPLCF